MDKSPLIREQLRQDEENMTVEEKNYSRNEFDIFKGLYHAFIANPSRENKAMIMQHDAKMAEIEAKMPLQYNF